MRSMCRVLIKKRLQCTTIRQKQSNCMSGSRKLFGTKLRNTFCRTVTGQNVLPVKTSYLSKVKTSHLSKRPRESKRPTSMVKTSHVRMAIQNVVGQNVVSGHPVIES